MTGPGPELARRILSDNRYLVLATADPDGRPWASPVWFAESGGREFYWVSSPDARHSRNIERRPDIAIVVFDSSVPVGEGQGVYVEAHATVVPADGLDRAIAVFNERSTRQGGWTLTAADVAEGASFRLYRAIARNHSMLAKDGAPDHRVPVDLGQGSAAG